MRLLAEYFQSGGATPAEFLTAASFAASDEARRTGQSLGKGLLLDAMNLSDLWDSATPSERERLVPRVQGLAMRVLAEEGEDRE